MKKPVTAFLISLSISLFSSAQDTVQKALWLEIGYRTSAHKNSSGKTKASYETESCWNCWDSYTYPVKNPPTYSQELYVQATFQKNNWLFLLQLGVMRSNEAIAGTRHVNLLSYYPSWDTGKYREYTIDYRASSYNLHLSTGIAWNVLSSERHFRFGPVLRINPTILLHRQVRSAAVIEHYRHYAHAADPSVEEFDEETYTTSNNAADFLKFKSFILNPSIGLLLGGKIGKINCQLEMGYSRQRHPGISFGELHRQSNYYLQLGISHRLSERE